MPDPSDWRLQGQEKYLLGVTLVRRRYRRYSATWDHDHCEFCGAKFMVEPSENLLHEGYATADDYRWVCVPCFDDFREQFDWNVVSETEAGEDA